ncbi:MAG: hypothetical protein AAB542_04400 [Patescibacteria group bacterium]
MKIDVAKQRILLLKDQVTLSVAEKKAWEKKSNAFDALSKVTGFFSRPKDEDFELTYSEHRYQPFWHVAANAKYVYDRNATYQVSVGGQEVKSVTVLGTDYQETNGHIHMPVTEHCTQEEHEVVYIDGVNGKNLVELAEYVKKPADEVKGKIENMVAKGSILVPPQARVSAIMRDALAKMIKGIQADTILEEHVEVSAVDLYYRPVYAFQFHWKSKGKDAIVEIDGVTGNVTSGSRIFREYLGKVLDTDFLFDIGADAAGIFIPGGSIAVKAARKYIVSKK